MKIIVPMAGRGSRLRPHTLTTPKPLIPIVGKAIVQRLVEDIVRICGEKSVEEIAFVIGDFGTEVEEQLKAVAAKLGAKGKIRVLVHSVAFAVNPSLYPNAGYDALKDFAPIILGPKTPNIFTANPGVSIKTLPELVEMAKKSPLNY